MISRIRPVMSELKDEDRWLKYFTIKQLIYYGIAIFIGIVETMLLHRLFHAEAIGFVLIIVNVAISVLLQLKIPDGNDKYIIGGGMPLQLIVFRLVLKSIPKNRVIYVKNYEASKEGAKEWMERYGNP